MLAPINDLQRDMFFVVVFHGSNVQKTLLQFWNLLIVLVKSRLYSNPQPLTMYISNLSERGQRGMVANNNNLINQILNFLPKSLYYHNHTSLFRLWNAYRNCIRLASAKSLNIFYQTLPTIEGSILLIQILQICRSNQAIHTIF